MTNKTKRECIGDEIPKSCKSESCAHPKQTANVKVIYKARKRQVPGETNCQWLCIGDILPCIFLFGLSLTMRLFKISEPHFCVFDEEHFGKFAVMYWGRKFFFDVHPPLGKLILSAVLYLSGFDTEMAYQNSMHSKWDRINQDYLESHNNFYIPLRVTCAIFGACTTPLFFLILRQLRYSLVTVVSGTLLFLSENSFVTFSRLIVLDPILWCFTLCTLLALTRLTVIEEGYFSSDEREKSLEVRRDEERRLPLFAYENSGEWRASLFLTGTFLGLTASVKLCGLFTVALVGIQMVANLYRIIANRRISARRILNILLFKIAALIVIPLTIMLTLYYVHVSSLLNTGPNDYLMSIPFQSSIQKNFYQHRTFNEMPLYVVHGSSIRIVMEDRFTISTMQGSVRYPARHPHGAESSQEIMVALTDVPSNEQRWKIMLVDGENREGEDVICNGSKVVFKSERSNCYLKISDFGSIITLHQMEISCGETATSVWEVVFLNEPSKNCSPLVVDSTTFFLKEVHSRRSLASSNIPLPNWVNDGYEIFASWDRLHYNHRLRIAENYMQEQLLKERKRQTDSPKQKPKMRVMCTLAKLWELFLKSFSVNNEFMVGHPFMSSPMSWPMMSRGILLFEAQPHLNVGSLYLLGNVVTWFASNIALVGTCVLYAAVTIRRLRGINDLSKDSNQRLHYLFWVAVCGWAIHFFPYTLLSRATFLHHYLTAVMFKILCCVGFVDILFGDVVRIAGVNVKQIVFGCLCLASLCFFVYFLPFIYAIPLSSEGLDNRNWFLGWGIGSED
eukprot:Nk52_evm1s300 gene=Nk52_evmTU1s300